MSAIEKAGNTKGMGPKVFYDAKQVIDELEPLAESARTAMTRLNEAVGRTRHPSDPDSNDEAAGDEAWTELERLSLSVIDYAKEATSACQRAMPQGENYLRAIEDMEAAVAAARREAAARNVPFSEIQIPDDVFDRCDAAGPVCVQDMKEAAEAIKIFADANKSATFALNKAMSKRKFNPTALQNGIRAFNEAAQHVKEAFEIRDRLDSLMERVEMACKRDI